MVWTGFSKYPKGTLVINFLNIKVHRCAQPFCAYVFFVSTCFGQESHKSDYLKAYETFYRAYETEGAQEFLELSQLTFTLKGSISNPRQAYKASEQSNPDGSTETFLGHWFFDFEHEYYRQYTRELYHGGHDLRWEELYRDDTSYFITTQMRKYNTSASTFDSKLSIADYIPGWFLAIAENNISSLTWLGQKELNGNPHDVFEVTWLQTRRRCYVNRDTGELTQITWLTNDLITGERLNVLKFEGRRKLAGLQVADEIVKFVNGHQWQSREINSLYTSVPTDEMFQLDPDLKKFDASTWEIVKVSEHVYEIMGLGGNLYTIPFIVLPSYILIYDAILSPGLMARAIKTIESKFVDIPIKYVVLSHNHTDHIRGLKAFRDKHVQVIASAENEMRITQLMEAPASRLRKKKSETSSESRYKIKLVAPGEAHSISGHGIEVSIHHIGQNPHTNDLLYVEVQPDNVLLQADSYFEFSAWSGIFDHLLKWVELKGLNNPIVTGVHHEALPLEEIQRRRETQTEITPGYLRKLKLNSK